MEQRTPTRAQLEREVAAVVGRNHARQAEVWQAIGILEELYGLDERASLAHLRRHAAVRGIDPAALAARIVSRQEMS